MIRERFNLRVVYNSDDNDVVMRAVTRAPAADMSPDERIGILQRRLLRRLLQDEALRDLARELLARYPVPVPSAEDALNRALVEDDIVRAVLPEKTPKLLLVVEPVPDEVPEKPWVPSDGRTWHELDDVRSWPHLHALLDEKVLCLKKLQRKHRRDLFFAVCLLYQAFDNPAVVAVAFSEA